MAFGATALEGTLIAIGTSGYILRFDLTNRRIKDVLLVQAVDMSKDPDDFSPATAVKKTDAELQALLETPAGAECSYCPNVPTVDVYLDSTKFPRQATTEVLVKFQRNATRPTQDDERADVPPEAVRLVHLYLQRSLRELQGKTVPDRLIAQINDERERLGLT